MGNGDNRGRDQGWGFDRQGGQDRERRDAQSPRGQGRGPEDRSFDRGRGHEGGEPWRGESRYGARYDQERTGYQARPQAGQAYGGYGGQEYGMEGGRDHRTTSDRDQAWRGDEREADQREQWRPAGGAPYGDLELNARNSGIQEFGAPHDYAYHPKAGHELDPDYLHWREQQMRSHDRDYHAWRQSQEKSYDEDYHKFRNERREHFGRTFADWRSQRDSVGGVPDQTAAGGVSGYGEHTGMPTGYGSNQSSKPNGMIEPMTSMNASAGAGQTGGQTGGQAGGQSGGSQGAQPSGDTSPEFGKEPSQVKAAADGWDGRGSAKDHEASRHKDDEGEKH